MVHYRFRCLVKRCKVLMSLPGSSSLVILRMNRPRCRDSILLLIISLLMAASLGLTCCLLMLWLHLVLYEQATRTLFNNTTFSKFIIVWLQRATASLATAHLSLGSLFLMSAGRSLFLQIGLALKAIFAFFVVVIFHDLSYSQLVTCA